MDKSMAAALAEKLRRGNQPTYTDGPPDAAVLRALMNGLPPEAPPMATMQPGWEKSTIPQPGPMGDKMGEFPMGPGDQTKPSIIEFLKQISRALRAKTQIGENP